MYDICTKFFRKILKCKCMVGVPFVKEWPIYIRLVYFEIMCFLCVLVCTFKLWDLNKLKNLQIEFHQRDARYQRNINVDHDRSFHPPNEYFMTVFLKQDYFRILFYIQIPASFTPGLVSPAKARRVRVKVLY